MDGASISQHKPKPLKKNSSPLCEANAHIHFQPLDYCDESQSSSNSSDHQTKDTLLSIVSPHLCRNRCLRRGLVEDSTDTSYRSNRESGSLVSLDHTKMLAETTCNLKVNLCFHGEPEKQYSNVKNRLKWSADLHHKFVTCVDLLGGAEKATPRAILKLMKSNELTIYHIKSHLQKYRNTKCITDSSKQGKSEKQIEDNDDLVMLYLKSGIQVKEILKSQQDVQRHLCQQLEVQQNMQQALEEQGKQIETMIRQLRKQK